MKQMGCEHETSVIRALHSGEWTNELRLHLDECQDCSQALHLAEALREAAMQKVTQCHPPDSHWILQRSRRMAREIAMRRMARLMTAMRTLAAVYAIVVAAWLLRGYAALQYREVASAMHGASSEFGLLGAVAAAVCVAAGLWPILRDDSQPGRG
jgi:hypothetical protein